MNPYYPAASDTNSQTQHAAGCTALLEDTPLFAAQEPIETLEISLSLCFPVNLHHC